LKFKVSRKVWMILCKGSYVFVRQLQWQFPKTANGRKMKKLFALTCLLKVGTTIATMFKRDLFIFAQL